MPRAGAFPHQGSAAPARVSPEGGDQHVNGSHRGRARRRSRAAARCPGEVAEPAAGPPAYADVTAPGRAPARSSPRGSPRWTRRNITRAGSAGYAWHAARYHGLRSPVYLAAILGCAVARRRRAGGPVAALVAVPGPRRGVRRRDRGRAPAVAPDPRGARREPQDPGADQRRRGLAAWWSWPARGCTRRRGCWACSPPRPRCRCWRGPAARRRRIVSPRTCPPRYEALTQDVITRALGVAGHRRDRPWLRDGHADRFAGPVREDGPGWRAEVDLPYGVTATRGDRAPRASSPPGCAARSARCGPSRSPASTPGAWSCGSAGRTSPRRKPAPWPLLKAGAADVFRPVPFGTDVRGRRSRRR